MDLREYAATLRKQWYVVALFTLLTTVAGLYYATSKPAVYQGTSQVFVSSSPGATIQDLVQGSNYTQNLVQSYAALAAMPVVLDPVIAELHLNTTSRALAKRVTASTTLNTVIINIAVTAPTAEGSAAISNAVANQLSTTIAGLNPSATHDEAVRLQVVSPASVPSGPIAPRKKLIVATFLLAGLALGVVVALLRQLLGTRLRNAEEISQVTSAAILGSIPRLATSGSAAVTAYSPRSIAAESYRRLQTNLQFLDVSAPVRSLVVTSALGGEGKSMTSINLALAIAEKGQRVLLVDADMRKPSIAEYCHLEQAVGLTTVLIGKAALHEVVQPWGHPTLEVLTSGSTPPNPSQLIDSIAMHQLLGDALDSYDVIIFDAPPLLPVSDGAVLARLTDGALVVAGCHQLRRHQLVEALATLETVGARCLGVVANRTRSRTTSSYYGEKPSRPWRRSTEPVGARG
ncbi:polysaccharide biosynthesis tyrosine autokinase [Nocardioides sp.]|uniref:polysaccharide biosynthesis tyrosine autokinase n=1 Tax=Nocardioides sp. TaxID=35761 RepID=UPI002605F0FB|nr:polysaccharide biosynthesis tyrosine autokinase [Nocardioides sp.]